MAAIYVDQAVTLWRIARRTGIAIRDQQDWRTLGLLLAFSALAALVAWAVAARYLAGAPPLPRVAAGATLVALAYAAMAAICGIGREWRTA